MRNTCLSCFSVVWIVTLAAPVPLLRAGDWPAYRGPNGDGISSEDLKLVWSGAPKVLWHAPTRSGFSSFTVGGGKAFTLVSHDGREGLVAMDAATGKEAWGRDVGRAKYDGGGDSGASDNKGGDGPRST